MEKFLLSCKMAIQSIFLNRLRSFLTLLGVVIGVGAVVAAVGLAEGTTAGITKEIEKLGTNLVYVFINPASKSEDISVDQFLEFARKNNDVIMGVSPFVQYPAQAIFRGKKEECQIIGATAEYMMIQNLALSKGRFISPVDSDFRQKVAVIGSRIRKKLFNSQNPVGQEINVNGQVFKVVGVLKEKQGGRDNTVDDSIIVPLFALNSLSTDDYALMKNFLVRTVSADKNNEVKKRIKAYLSSIIKKEENYTVYDMSELMSTLNQITYFLMIILGGIATISLVVGGIGIMNIMLVSVTERTREIGIRKAIGAKRSDIRIQFLIESMVITGVGGIIGILLGFFVIALGISRIPGVEPVYSLKWAFVAFGISVLIGVIFGMLPAEKAARLNPIEALRYE
ncbi:protein of unknown function DUF214 [Caldicellulosiruptor saccharolyticus DSM 8903]|uniref:FtsX-like permease family protein n=1 Tax=Caldicellulosiruptor saccharolyticus (strain ATCC 43494 / DSM 8903 / Tp8T 6331) TaxID=351627 RepID=A4XGX8_CALS8|nr:ABC transporter permease [Caldicellulosiruptor saccharolyticus]ABP66163.1 protein of unknown function DUF214 [Caldicellulosiruptor saccharolyticus DSM 8903]